MQIILQLLAITRLTEILQYERIFLPLREAVGIYHDGDGIPVTHDDTHRYAFFGSLLSCFSCTSVWVTFGLLLLTRLYPNVGGFVSSWFGLNKVVLRVKGLVSP